MTKQEQVKQMAKERIEIKAIMKLLDRCGSLNPMCKAEVATIIYGNNYRKVPENAVVITKDELKQYKVQAVREFADKLKSEMLDREYNGIHYKWGAFSDNEIDELLKEHYK